MPSTNLVAHVTIILHSLITTAVTRMGLDAIIIGAGPSGIAMAYKLKHELGFEDFTIYERLDGVGGTWRSNTYPGW